MSESSPAIRATWTRLGRRPVRIGKAELDVKLLPLELGVHEDHAVVIARQHELPNARFRYLLAIRYCSMSTLVVVHCCGLQMSAH